MSICIARHIDRTSSGLFITTLVERGRMQIARQMLTRRHRLTPRSEFTGPSQNRADSRVKKFHAVNVDNGHLIHPFTHSCLSAQITHRIIQTLEAIIRTVEANESHVVCQRHRILYRQRRNQASIVRPLIRPLLRYVRSCHVTWRRFVGVLFLHE